MLATVLVVLGSVTAFTVAGPASPAVAAANYDCGTIYSIQGTGDRNVRRVDAGSGATTNLGRFVIANSSMNLNGLGLANDGSKAYGVLPAELGNGRGIYVYDRATDTTSRLGDGVAGSPVTHGAINPRTGIYYYGGFSEIGQLRIYGYNPATNTSLGLVASGNNIPDGGRNGDWAFDQQGNLYVVGGAPGDNRVSVINQAMPSTPQGTPLAISATQLVRTNAATAVNGIAFGGDGFLYITSGASLFKINPSTGAIEAGYPKVLGDGNSGSVDLASCASPNSIKVVKDFPNGRVAPTDQATVSVTGGGITGGNTGTTQGNDSGLQEQPGEFAGPVLALTGNTYTVSETGAAIKAPGYISSYRCVDQNSGTVLASGSGTSTSFTMPPGGTKGVAALCTFTNAAQIPAISLDKQAGAATGNTVGSTIAYTFVVTNTGNVPLATVTVNDPKVGTVTCPPGVLAPGASRTCTAAPYVLTQDDLDNGKVDNTAVATGVPSTPGLPTVKDDDSTTTPIAQTPKLVLTKKAGTPVDANGSGLTDAGDTIQYTFTVKNDGNLRLTNLRIVDPLVGAVTCAATSLAPGATTTCVADATYTITEADESNGKVVNTARAIANRPGGAEVPSNEASTTTPVQKPTPKLIIEKRAGTPVDVNESGLTDAGDTIAFTFTVTNDGNVPLTDIAVLDPLAGAVTCEATSLAVGASTECAADATYTITDADQLAGAVVNTALAEGTDPDGGNVLSPPDSTRTPVQTPAPELTIDKRAGTPVDVNESGITDAGDTIAFTFTVTNDGNVPLTDIVVNDPLVGSVTCEETTLAPGASTECAADEPYVITAADEDNRVVTNTATAEGEDPDGETVPSDPDSTNTPVDEQAPALTLEKFAGVPVDVNESGLTDAGDTIAYTFTLTNDGNVPLRNLVVEDPLVGAITCEETRLAPGASTECAADEPYVITEADEAAGEVVNVAVAEGTDPDGEPAPSNEDTTTTPVDTPAPSLSIDKIAAAPVDVNESGITDAGDTIAYAFLVTNTGNVPLRAVEVADPMVGAVSCPKVNLGPGESTLCTAAAPYVITADDEAAGSVDNVAHATGVDPDDEPVRSNDDETSTPVTTPAPKLSIEKRAGTPVDVNGSGITDAGDTIEFTFTVTNDGNVPLTGIVVDDPLAGAVTCEETALAPGASTECAADAVYVVTEADEDAGHVHNVATATGEDPDGEPTDPSEPGETETPVEKPVVELVLDKVAGTPVDVNESGITDAGDTIAYTFTVTNAGNVPVQAIAVVDPRAGAVTCEETTLAPGASTECAADAAYVITEADEKSGSADNVAHATGVDPDGEPAKSNDDDTTTPVQTPAPKLTIEKRAGTPVDVNESGLTDAGDTIAFTFTVTNEGNVPVSNVVVSDPLAGAVTCEETTLAPGASTECAADAAYVVTEADELAGNVHNVATVTGEDPDGEPTPPAPPGETDTPVDLPEPKLVLDKHAGTPVDVNESGITDAGDTIAFTFTVTNEGNVPITGIVVSDPLAGAVTCEETTLAPGASTECAADEVYTITAADEKAELVRNTATAEGEDPDGETVPSDPDSTNTPTTPQAPAITLEKHAGTPVDVNESGITDAGDTIAYTFTVTNDGNVPVFDVTVTDPKAGAVTCPPGRLGVGESVECAADAPYVVTEADEEAGAVVNVATARATDPDDEPVDSNEDTTTTPVQTPDPKLGLDKQAGEPVDTNGNGVTDAGDTITYTFVVTNEGNVPVTGVTIDDPMLGGDAVTCEATSLAPGAVTTCTADHVLTQADVDNGEVRNTATATGTDPDGDPVESPEDSTETPIPSAPRLDLVKKAALDDKDGDDRADVGETIRFSFVVTNTGNVTLTDVAVDDPMVGAVTCDVDALAPGASVECVADAAYVVTQADVDAGQVHNVATASATPPKGDPVDSPESETTTPTDSRAALALVKDSELVDGNDDGNADPGERIRYTFTVTNTGTVSVSSLAIDDDMLAEAGVEITCKATELAPGEKTTCAAVYTVTDADMSADFIVNVATANGCAALASGAGQRAEACSPVVSNEDDTKTPSDRGVLPEDTGDNGDKGDDGDGSNGVLPNTGGPMGLLLWLGLALLLGGGGVMTWSRRRRA